jgi:hypothetical protein
LMLLGIRPAACCLLLHKDLLNFPNCQCWPTTGCERVSLNITQFYYTCANQDASEMSGSIVMECQRRVRAADLKLAQLLQLSAQHVPLHNPNSEACMQNPTILLLQLPTHAWCHWRRHYAPWAAGNKVLLVTCILTVIRYGPPKLYERSYLT